MLKVVSLPKFKNEKKYILDVILCEFLGLDYTLEFAANVTSTLFYGELGRIEMPDIFFSIDESQWLTESNMPKLPLRLTNINFEGTEFIDLPVIFGSSNNDDIYTHNDIYNVNLGIDVIGSAFFMLTRYEEYVLNQYRDLYDRFPVEQSLAFKYDFLDRPIINEYVELLWLALKIISPGLKKRSRTFKVIPTHDIDKPFGMAYDSKLQIIRHLIGDIVIRHSYKKLFARVIEICSMMFAHHAYIKERLETFDFFIEESKRHGLKDIFFFMNSKCSLYDGNYTVDHCDILELIKKIIKEGHLIGLHPSYISYMDGQEIKNESVHMNKVLLENGFSEMVGARQHFLKWKNPDTWQHYEDAGIPFDSTMTYAGHVGFRSGICYPYPVYNIVERKILNLIERPLIVMDGSLFDYMKLSNEEAMLVIKKLASKCKKYNGEFIFLWHNTMLDDIDKKSFYKNMLIELCKY